MVRSSVENVYANPDKISDELIERYFELSLREGNRQAFIDRFKNRNRAHLMNIFQRLPKKRFLWGEKDFLIPVDNAYLF